MDDEASGAIPGYWMNETGDLLRPAVRSDLNGATLTEAEIAALRAYLRQWIASPMWMGPDIELLRRGVDGLVSRSAINRWLALALESNIDPL